MEQNAYFEKIMNEFQDVSEEEMPIIMEFLHYFKIGLKEQKKKSTYSRDSLLDLKKFTIDTGISDLAENHDYYLYGVTKE